LPALSRVPEADLKIAPILIPERWPPAARDAVGKRGCRPGRSGAFAYGREVHRC
jgi:hypothetical protein